MKNTVYISLLLMVALSFVQHTDGQPFPTDSTAQEVWWPAGDSSLVVTTCNALFYDSGGPTGNISSVNQNLNSCYATFVSSAGSHVKCEFTQFSVNGVLKIYDGLYNDPNKRLIGQFHTSTLDASTNNMPPVLFSTGSALTFVYYGADGDMMKAGWAATITCVDRLMEFGESPFLGIRNLPLASYANTPDPHNIQLDTANPVVTLKAAVNAPSSYTNDYSVTQIPFDSQVFEFNQGTSFGASTEDSWQPGVQLPFTFSFFGKPYTTVYPSTNGLISMSPQSGYCAYSYESPQTTPPYSSVPYQYQNCIYGVFEDIDSRYFTNKNDDLGMGAVRAGVFGESPCQAFVFNYLNVGLYGLTNNSTGSQYANYNTYQMVLYEGTNIIDIYIKHRKCCATTNSHGEGIIGLQNSTSSQILLAPGRGMTGWNADNEAWRFTPISPLDEQGELTWYADTVDPAAVLGHDSVIAVQPQTSTRYISEYSFTDAFGNPYVLRDTTLVICPETDTTGIADRSRALEVWPNPTRDAVYVQWTAPTEMPSTIEILDLQGRPLIAVPAQETTRVDLSRLPAGTYLLKSGRTTVKVMRQ